MSEEQMHEVAIEQQEEELVYPAELSAGQPDHLAYEEEELEYTAELLAGQPDHLMYEEEALVYPAELCADQPHHLACEGEEPEFPSELSSEESDRIAHEEEEPEFPSELFSEESNRSAYEEELVGNSDSVGERLCYAEFPESGRCTKAEVKIIFERALNERPESYEIWHQYLLELIKLLDESNCPVDHPDFEDVNNTFERALLWMHRMPRMWMMYFEFLHRQGLMTRLRQTFDRALRSLPITQRDQIWSSYLELTSSHDILGTGVSVYQRLLNLSRPDPRERAVEYLILDGRLAEAAQKMTDMVKDPLFISAEGKSKNQLWIELCDLMSKNPDDMQDLDVEAIIRCGLENCTDQLGRLWCSLAEYHIRSQSFESAREVFEEAMDSVSTMDDFAQIFDAYSEFESTVIHTMLARVLLTIEDELDIELRAKHYICLWDRRPLLVNSVLLRQNPHNVHVWLERVKLLGSVPYEVLKTFTKAVHTVDPKLAHPGKLSQIWTEFARFFESRERLDYARETFRSATQVPYADVDELADVWCAFIEMELRHGNHEEAINLCYTAISVPTQEVAHQDRSDNETVQMQLYRNIRVWSLCADLEERFGTIESTKTVYNHMFELRIASPQIIIKAAQFFEKVNYSEAFQVYETGISLFEWPHVNEIWNAYLTTFMNKSGGTEIGRARGLFERCLDQCPREYAKDIFLLYAQLEERYGLASHAMAIYERAEDLVPDEEKKELFELHIERATELFGLRMVRPIYEKAIVRLPHSDAIEMCVKFAKLECRLGNVDGTRMIYMQCSQSCDPSEQKDFWNEWSAFEIVHGNEETMNELLRMERRVREALNAQIVAAATAQLNAAGGVLYPVETALPADEEMEI